jgi:hypothetical protein
MDLDIRFLHQCAELVGQDEENVVGIGFACGGDEKNTRRTYFKSQSVSISLNPIGSTPKDSQDDVMVDVGEKKAILLLMV